MHYSDGLKYLSLACGAAAVISLGPSSVTANDGSGQTDTALIHSGLQHPNTQLLRCQSAVLRDQG